MTNNRYSYETKLEAVRLLNTGMSGREIVQRLGLKSDGLIHTWRKYVRNAIITDLDRNQVSNINTEKVTPVSHQRFNTNKISKQ